ncbi:MAG TPA: ATP-binding protein, partial [Ktedonobacteraceae bacterium]|nr:ATP-binding protein [Ktedonobacteraceae bacterium]
LRSTPSYFFLIWRWVSWLFALIWIASEHFQPNPQLAMILLTITFLHTLGVTLYAPIFQIFLPGLPGLKQVRSPVQRTQQMGKLRTAALRNKPRPLAADEEADILTPIARTRNLFWDVIIYGGDVVICGLVMYFGGIYGNPYFGDGSPFYRYAISTALAAALTYRYKGGLAAAAGIEFFVLLGVFLPPLGLASVQPNAIDLTGSLIDAPVIALLAAYLATLLENYARSKRREQDNVRNQLALRSVSETLMQGAGDVQHLLEQSAEQIRKGGHFERLFITLVETVSDEGNESSHDRRPQASETRVDVGLGEAIAQDESRALLGQVMQTGKKLITFTPLPASLHSDGYQLARLYLPFFKDGQVHVVLGAESTRQTPFDSKQETFLNIVGAQLLVALDNLRLTQQTAELAAEAERTRIARDIHDGVAQIIYMLSLNTETCAALAHRIAGVSEEDNELLGPLAERLDSLVNLSKQALWETRHYMFTLKPLFTGTSNLTQMLTNQLREFETISGLPVSLTVEGEEETRDSEHDRQHTSGNTVQVGTAIFRITQEALTNAYKHAGATQLHVFLRHLAHWVEVEIVDNGKGMAKVGDSSGLNGSNGKNGYGEQQRIYSGHGIPGMRERAEELGGTFELRPGETGGTHVLARIPT